MIEPSRYDDGEDNWNSKRMGFDDWLRADKPSKIVHDKRTTDEMRRRMYADRRSFEPEFT
jgi:hypothetical protein